MIARVLGRRVWAGPLFIIALAAMIFFQPLFAVIVAHAAGGGKPAATTSGGGRKPVDSTVDPSINSHPVKPSQHEDIGAHQVYDRDVPGQTSRRAFTRDDVAHKAIEGRYNSLLQKPVPGARPELAILLDRDLASMAVRKMETVWGSRPLVGLVKSQQLLLDLLGQMKGKTLILVGHIENQNYVLYTQDGQTIEYNIKELTKHALEQKVLLIAIGCNSLAAGLPIGHTRTIDTNEVATFLSHVQEYPRSVYEIISALETIPGFTVQIDAAARWLEAIYRNPETQNTVASVALSEHTLGALPYTYSGPDQYFLESSPRFQRDNFFVLKPQIEKKPFELTYRILLIAFVLGVVSILPNILRAQWFRTSPNRLKFATGALPTFDILQCISIFMLTVGVIFSLGGLIFAAVIFGAGLFIIIPIVLYVILAGMTEKDAD